MIESLFFFEEELETEDDNSHYLANIALSKQLLKDLKLFPIWGNIASPSFKFGRVPASSAPVEGEMNKLKTNFMAQYNHRVRVDEFVRDHTNHLQGKSLLINADLQKKIDDQEISTVDECCQVCSKAMTLNPINCSMCDSAVHESCSRVHDSFLICNSCSQIDHVRKLITLNEVENWRGKGLAGEITRKKNKKSKNLESSPPASTDEDQFSENSPSPAPVCIDAAINSEDLTTLSASVSNIMDNFSFCPTCPACKNISVPDGAHKCISCKKLVHGIEPCSKLMQGAEEKYGDKRICWACFDKFELEFSSQNRHGNINTNCQNVEPAKNRKNRENKKTVLKTRKTFARTAKYLGQRKNDVLDSIIWEKNKPLPIIKNGSNNLLALSKIKKREVSLTNTCAFDSILYLTLIAVTDNSYLLEKVSKNLFIKLHAFFFLEKKLTSYCFLKYFV